MSAPTQDLHDVIARRRDGRAELTGAPVPGEVLTRVLAAAHASPSVGHSQPWDFVVRDRGTRERFRAHVAAERAACAADLPPERAETFARIEVEGVLEPTLGVVVTHDPERHGWRERRPLAEAVHHEKYGS